MPKATKTPTTKAAPPTKAPKPSTPTAGDVPAAWRVTDAELAALAALGKEGVWQVGGNDLKLTNLDKTLFAAEPPVTKRELIRYFARIAPTMLPHLADRPLNLQRFPNGAGAPGFWQKDIPATAPGLADAAGTRPASTAARTATPTTTSSPTGRRALCLARQPGELRDPRLDRPPARAVAPDVRATSTSTPATKTTWEETLVLARLYRTALAHLGVRGYPKTTGKRGIQVWIPIEPHYTFERHQRLGRAGQPRRRRRPCPTSCRGSGPRRRAKGKARLDYTQNASIKTLVAPYAVRPADRARRSPRRSPGTSWTTPTCGPIAGRSGRSSSASRERGDLFAAAQTDLQELPTV